MGSNTIASVKPIVLLLQNNEEFHKRYKKILLKTFNKCKSAKETKKYVKSVEKSVKCFIKVISKDFETTRDSFRLDYPKEYSVIYPLFKSFSTLKKLVDILFLDGKGGQPKQILREDMYIPDKYDKSKYPRRIFISALIPEMPLSNRVLRAIKVWQNDTGGDFKLLAMRGSNKEDGFSLEQVDQFKNELVTELQINSNLIAEDFQLYPQMIIPLTGLARFGQKKFSVIIAAPKQMMLSIAQGKNRHPHIVYSTGTVNSPDYRYDRPGKIATQDHKIGGLIVEIRDDKTFFIRNVSFDSKYGFADIDKYYSEEGVSENKADALILGDTHYGIEDQRAIAASKRLAKLIDPKYIVFHDLCDNRSICHHELHSLTLKWHYPEHQRTLESELNHAANEIKKWTEDFKKSQLVVLPSNHDDFIAKWLNTGLFATDRLNARVGADLFMAALDNKNPIEYFFEKYHGIKTLKFLKRNDGFMVNGCELNVHGDKGNNGAKGSPRGLELGYGKCVAGHTHAPYIFRDVFGVGTNSVLDPDYTAGGGSSWLHADVILHKNGERQLIIKVDGEFRLEELEGIQIQPL